MSADSELPRGFSLSSGYQGPTSQLQVLIAAVPFVSHVITEVDVTIAGGSTSVEQDYTVAINGQVYGLVHTDGGVGTQTWTWTGSLTAPVDSLAAALVNNLNLQVGDHGFMTVTGYDI